MSQLDFTIERLDLPTYPSPLRFSHEQGDFKADFVTDSQRVIYRVDVDLERTSPPPQACELLEVAGPRARIAFAAAEVAAGIVTCGGLCPGLNDVIRAIVLALWHRYGVRRVSGFRYGYRGLLPEFNLEPLCLTPEVVGAIHQRGGTLLGSSRGHGDRTGALVDRLEKEKINLLFVIGGDGTQKGALALFEELKRRRRATVVIGIPKTIDNDLSFVQRSFGFETSVSLAAEAVAGAHVEASGAIDGVGIVKVMGRQSGFIAAQTTLANNDVNFCLIPEVPFALKGDNGLCHHLEERLQSRGHAVILLAEGAGQPLLDELERTDASGNKKMADIGLYVKAEIARHFKDRQKDVNIKYIDPSYLIRSAPANANDSVYCARLGTNAVHAAMTGRTGMLVSLIHDRFVHVPMRMAVSERNVINPDGSLWRDVLDTTGQPPLMTN